MGLEFCGSETKSYIASATKNLETNPDVVFPTAVFSPDGVPYIETPEDEKDEDFELPYFVIGWHEDAFSKDDHGVKMLAEISEDDDSDLWVLAIGFNPEITEEYKAASELIQRFNNVLAYSSKINEDEMWDNPQCMRISYTLCLAFEED